MQLLQLAVHDFRILASIQLALHPQLSLILGDNGAGKSSLLEAVKLLGKAKLTPQLARDHCRHGQTQWKIHARWQQTLARDLQNSIDPVAGEVADEPEQRSVTTLANLPALPAHEAELWWRQGLNVTLDFKPAPAIDLARVFIAAPLDCSVQRIIAEGPALRRQFLDWSLFHVEHLFQSRWSVWRRHLVQRNRLLATQADLAQIRAWNEGLVQAAEHLNQLRQQFVAALQEPYQRWCAVLLGDFSNDKGSGFGLKLISGWPVETDYASHLLSVEARDQQRRMTVDGPQRADLELSAGAAPARLLSRGQQKLMYAALLLSGCEVIAQRSGRWPLVLVDDFDAELAAPARAKFRDALLEYPGQKIVTQHTAEPGFWSNADHKMFHVEHGRVSERVK